MMAQESRQQDMFEAEVQDVIETARRDVRYLTTDLPIESLVRKYSDEAGEEGDIYVPDYQRELKWDDHRKSYFIESLILRMPVPPLFFYEVDGLLEIVDGSQRIRTLVEFINNEFKLKGLEKLEIINGMKFEDLPEATRKRFLNNPIRTFVLEEGTDQSTRIELFRRINTSPKPLTDSEIRKGAYRGVFLDLIMECADIDIFKQLVPVTGKRTAAIFEGERQELITRFFIYSIYYEEFVHDVRRFIDERFIKFNKELSSDVISNMKTEFECVMHFIQDHMPNGFYRDDRNKQVPRVRFEAVAVGTALALREQPDLDAPTDTSFLRSEEFSQHVRTDASNSGPKLKARIEFVRDHLLGR